MKRSIIYLFTLLPFSLLAQVDRSKAPKPTAAPEIKVSKPATFTLPNGLKVFVVQNSKLPRVSATLTFDMDGIVEGEKAGLTDLAGALIRRGTTTLNKQQLDEQIDFLGASINTSATSVSASSLSSNFSRVFALMSDVVLRPSLPASELEKIRKQTLSGLQAEKDDQDAIARNVVNRLTYGKNHPYGDIETEETVNNITLPDIKNYFATYWKPNNAYLVLVGDISPEKAKSLVTANFGSWKQGTVPKVNYKTPQAPSKTFIAVVDRPASTQSNITFIAPIELKPGAPDVIPASVMNNILGEGSSGRLFMNLREKRGFTYGAYSSINSDRLIGSFSANAKVRTEKTDSAVGEFIAEFREISNGELAEQDVLNMKNQLSGRFARSLENPGTIAQFALNIARNKLPGDYYQNYLKNLAAVSPQTVKQVASKYVKPANMIVVVVGNAKEIEGLDKYGEVKYFDAYGNEKEAPVVKKADASVTTKSILQKAVEAIGGENAIASIKDIQLKGSATMMGQQIAITQKGIIPMAYVMEVKLDAMNMVVQKEMVKDGKYSIEAQGQSQEVDAEGKEDLDEKAAFFSEVFLLNHPSYQTTLKGIEQVDGKDVYAVGVKTPSGKEYTNYYEVSTGLKVQRSSMEEMGPQKINVVTSFKEYKTFNGVKIPTRIIVDLGMMKQDISFQDIQVNKGLKTSDIN